MAASLKLECGTNTGQRPSHRVMRPVRSPLGVRTKQVRRVLRQKEPCVLQLLENNVCCCVLPTWWLLRGGCTRSHSEHGRETPQRQWYSVLRRGRVGRCQVCKTQHHIQHLLNHKNKRPQGQSKAAHNAAFCVIKHKNANKAVRPIRCAPY